MPAPTSHHLIDVSIHAAVETDHVAREALYTTVYDDGSEGTTIHMLYWHKQDEEVQSGPIEEWAVISQLPAVGG